MVFLRKVRTASGAIAVQIAVKDGRRDRVIEHLGSAHSEAELAVLMEIGRGRLHPGQGVLDLGFDDGVGRVGGSAVVEGQVSRILIEVIRAGYDRLGFDVVGDEAFFQLVLARLVEPTSKSDSVRVLRELGVDAVHLSTIKRSLARSIERDYRSQLALKCFEYAATSGDVSLVLYDVTTLYFEAEKEDGLRKVGYSKERRVDPQIVVGLLVDRNGFPLEIGCFEGNKAETKTIIPIVEQFQDRHSIEEMVVVADAGMLSALNLRALDQARLRFIVGSRVTKAPNDLESHFRWHGDAFKNGQIIDTVTARHGQTKVNDVVKRAEPIWDPDQMLHAWRAIWQYSAKRAVRDNRTLNLQEQRAQAIIAGEKQSATTRFVKTSMGGRSLDTKALSRARALIGLKGYVTNIPARLMSASEVISSYHDLWQVEQSFRMTKTDLRARPIFHRTKDAIEAHLTIVFAALAIARHLQDATGISIRKIIQTLRPLQDVSININGHQITATPQLDQTTQNLLRPLAH